MLSRCLCRSIVLILSLTQVISFFHVKRNIKIRCMEVCKKRPLLQLSMNQMKASLDERTLWRLSIKLQKDGFKETNADIQIRFVEERGYEPPSGKIFVQDDYYGLVKCDDKGYSGTWSLSEDKEDRKDGLWIWGLFEEPKYPFLYTYLDIYDNIVLPSGEEEPIFGGKGVPNNRLLIRFSHSIDKQRGTILSDASMVYKVTELQQVDPLGIGGKVDVGDTFPAGSLAVRPVFGDSNMEFSPAKEEVEK